MRVIQVGTGPLGRVTLKRLIEHPHVDVVGAHGRSSDKVGMDVGTLVGRDPIGVRVTDNLAELAALDADCAVFMTKWRPAEEMLPELLPFLRAGTNVVTTTDWFDPRAHADTTHHDMIAEACRNGGSSLVATGLNPGFVIERLGLALTGLCTRVDHIHLIERYDCSSLPKAAAGMGFGQPVSVFDANAQRWHRFDYLFRQVPYHVCRMLGRTPEKVTVDTDIAPASKTIALADGIVEPGTVAGMRWRWSAVVDGAPMATVETLWIVDPDIPGWEAAGHWTLIVEGVPSFRLVLDLGQSFANPESASADGHYSLVVSEAIAGAVINALPMAQASSPGLVFFEDAAPLWR